MIEHIGLVFRNAAQWALSDGGGALAAWICAVAAVVGALHTNLRRRRA